MARGEQGGDKAPAVVSHNPAVRAGDFLDEAVRSKKSELAGDCRGLTALFIRGVGFWIEFPADIAIAQPVQRELAAADELKQGSILHPRVEGAETLTIDGHDPTCWSGYF